MQRHETPINVARELCKQAPRVIGSIIDPAGGTGALLTPLIYRLKQPSSRVTCVDVDASALKEVQPFLRSQLGNAVRIINADFLSWSERHCAGRRSGGYDCVIMNPPFAGKKDQWIELDLAHEFPGMMQGIRYAPREIGFLARGIRLLNEGGRLLAIMPGSLVSSQTTRWFRDCLLKVGRVTHVHELPQFTFPGVESRVYFVVFEKRKGEGKIVLCNHDLVAPEKMSVKCTPDDEEHRWDYGYHFARERLRRIVVANNMTWCSLGAASDILRGSAESPGGPDRAVHTNDYRNGFWRRAHRHKRHKRRLGRELVQAGDILVKRVGRRGYLTFGKAVGVVGTACSDCLLIVRPRIRLRSTELLFAIRTLTAFSWVRPLFERGTGASFQSEKGLREMPVPIEVSNRFPKMFRRYKDAILHRDYEEMQRIENWVAAHIEAGVD